MTTTPNEKIFIGKQVTIDKPWLMTQLEKMRQICATNDKEAVVEQLKVLVPTFNHDKSYLRAISGTGKVVASGEKATQGVIGSKPVTAPEEGEKKKPKAKKEEKKGEKKADKKAEKKTDKKTEKSASKKKEEKGGK